MGIDRSTVSFMRVAPRDKVRRPRSAWGLVLAAILLLVGVGAVVAPAPTASAAGLARLTWAPPTLSSPTTISITNGNSKVTLDTGRDYVIDLPATPITAKGGVIITGGRNIVLIGGEIRHDIDFGGDDGINQRGVFVKNWTGTLHIEGLWITGRALGEGIDVDTVTAGTTLQVQNVRIDTVHGSRDSNHADVIQNWGGPTTYRIDGLTGATTYQGLFIQSVGAPSFSTRRPPTKDLDFRHVNLRGGRYPYSLNTTHPTKWHLEEAWSAPSINPGSCGCWEASDPLWAGLKRGTPSGGDWVAAGVAGAGYQSPGYAGGPSPTPPPPPPPSGPSPLISESFDSDASRFSTAGGTWSVRDGRYVLSSPATASTHNANRAVHATTVLGDFLLKANASTVGTSSAWNDFSVLFGYTDVDNYYFASFNESNDANTSGIFKVQGGVLTQLANITALITADTMYHVTVERTGSTIRVLRNGTVVATATDSTFTSGKVGFGTRNDAAVFDNLTVNTTTTAPTEPAPNGPAGAWSLVFREEFTGTALDLDKWDVQDGWVNSGATYRTANVRVEGGNAVLTLQPDGTSGAISSTLWEDPAGPNAYLFPVGHYIEARVYLPGDPLDGAEDIYNWPAFWTSGPEWPNAGEHDVAEGLGGTLTVNYHGTTNSQNYGAVPGDWNNAFHTYGVHRKATSADVYWDGVLVKSYPTGDNGLPQSVIATLGRSSSHTPVTGAAGEIKVDYIRAWRPAN